MATRIGTVLVFKPEVTKEQAAQALADIAHVLDLPETTTAYEPTGESDLVEQLRRGQRSVRPVKRPFQMADKIHEFDDYGGSEGPVWYIPNGM